MKLQSFSIFAVLANVWLAYAEFGLHPVQARADRQLVPYPRVGKKAYGLWDEKAFGDPRLAYWHAPPFVRSSEDMLYGSGRRRKREASPGDMSRLRNLLDMYKNGGFFIEDITASKRPAGTDYLKDIYRAWQKTGRLGKKEEKKMNENEFLKFLYKSLRSKGQVSKMMTMLEDMSESKKRSGNKDEFLQNVMDTWRKTGNLGNMMGFLEDITVSKRFSAEQLLRDLYEKWPVETVDFLLDINDVSKRSQTLDQFMKKASNMYDNRGKWRSVMSLFDNKGKRAPNPQAFVKSVMDAWRKTGRFGPMSHLEDITASKRIRPVPRIGRSEGTPKRLAFARVGKRLKFARVG